MERFFHPHVADAALHDLQTTDESGLALLVANGLDVRRVNRTTQNNSMRFFIQWVRQPTDTQKALAATLLDDPLFEGGATFFHSV